MATLSNEVSPESGLLSQWVILALLLILARLVYPLDTYFINDEPKVLLRALELNNAGQIARSGLTGLHINYGPLPTWIYQILLRLAPRSPEVWLWIKTVCISAITLASVCWLIMLDRKVPRWVIVVPFLSPYLWLYSRDLWDNSWNTAWSAMLFVSTIAQLMKPRALSLALVVVSATASILTHPMTLPLVTASFAFVGLSARHWLRKTWIGAALVALGSILLASPYLHYLATSPRESGVLDPSLSSFLFSMLGARILSASGLDYFMGSRWFIQPGFGWFLFLAVAASSLSFLVVLRGFWSVSALALQRKLPALFVVTALALHVLLMTAEGLRSHPHYYVGIWIVFFYLLAVGFANWRSRGWSWTYVAGLCLSTAAMIGLIHRNSGNRELHYGSTLGNQLQVAADLNCLIAHEVIDERTHSYPQAVALLRRVTPCSQPWTKREDARIVYVSPDDHGDGRIHVQSVPKN